MKSAPLNSSPASEKTYIPLLTRLLHDDDDRRSALDNLKREKKRERERAMDMISPRINNKLVHILNGCRGLPPPLRSELPSGLRTPPPFDHQLSSSDDTRTKGTTEDSRVK